MEKSKPKIPIPPLFKKENPSTHNDESKIGKIFII